MSDQSIEGSSEHRERLVPVVGAIVGTYAAIVIFAYFVGNMIHQIP